MQGRLTLSRLRFNPGLGEQAVKRSASGWSEAGHQATLNTKNKTMSRAPKKALLPRALSSNWVL